MSHRGGADLAPPTVAAVTVRFRSRLFIAFRLRSPSATRAAQTMGPDKEERLVKLDPILIPVGGSALAESAIATAVDMARPGASTIMLMRAAEAHTLPGVDPTAAQVQIVGEAAVGRRPRGLPRCLHQGQPQVRDHQVRAIALDGRDSCPIATTRLQCGWRPRRRAGPHPAA